MTVGSGDDAPPGASGQASLSLRPRWLWALFAVVALLIPAIGFWLERR